MEDEEYTEDDFGEKEYLIEDPRGFDVVARHLANKLSKDTLLLSHLVTKIRTSDGKVTVETSQGNFQALHVIVTVSIGVLKSQKIVFEPPLPKWKQDALSRVEMSSYCKVFIAWDTQWWNLVKNAYTVCVDSVDQERWLVFKQTSLSHPILQYTLVADEAKRVSKLSAEQIKAEVCAKLSKVFPSVGVPEPLDILVTGWDDNPLFLGAYSFMPVQDHHDPIGELAKPV